MYQLVRAAEAHRTDGVNPAGIGAVMVEADDARQRAGITVEEAVATMRQLYPEAAAGAD